MKMYLFNRYDCDCCGIVTEKIVFANSKEEALQMILDDENNYFKTQNGEIHAFISKNFEKEYRNEIIEVLIPESPQIVRY